MPEMCKAALQIKHKGFYYVVFHMCLILSYTRLKPLAVPTFSLQISPSSECWIVLGHGQFVAGSAPSSLHHYTDNSLNYTWASFLQVVSRKRRTLPNFNFVFRELTCFCIITAEASQMQKAQFCFSMSEHSLVSGSSCALLLNCQICSNPSLLQSVYALLLCTNDSYN